MEFLPILLIAIIVLSLFVVKTIIVNGENNRRVLTETSPDYQSKLRTIRDLINFQDEHVSYTELICRYEDELSKSTDKKRSSEIISEIEILKKTRKELTESFHKKYKNDPYNPSKIPFEEFPDNLLQRLEEIEARLVAVTRIER